LDVEVFTFSLEGSNMWGQPTFSWRKYVMIRCIHGETGNKASVGDINLSSFPFFLFEQYSLKSKDAEVALKTLFVPKYLLACILLLIKWKYNIWPKNGQPQNG
jgi:hypothetical protein